MKRQTRLYPKAASALERLGENIKLARRRRGITSALMAERADLSLMTLRAIERGSPKVAMGNYMSVLFCASSVAAPVAIRLLQAIDNDSPGTVANARDIFGNNAFWYSIYRSGNLPWEDERDFKALEAALMALGCDPNAPNRLDLTCSSIMKAQRALAAFQSV